MFHIRNLLQFLHKTSLLILLILSIIMLLHVLIATLGTNLMLWHTDSTPLDIALITFIYYVIPLIAFLSFHLVIAQLLKLYDSVAHNNKHSSNHTLNSKSIRNINSKSSKSRTVPNDKSKSPKSRTVPKKEKKSEPIM